jgi:hypothetical protein
VEVRVLSNRADLVSGGDALIELVVPDDDRDATVVVRNGEADISAAFARRPNGRYLGLVQGLAVGANVLTATLPDGRGARLTVTNHPIGGPIFSGPQIQPWVCETERAELGTAQDEQCNAPTIHKLLYMPTGGGPFRPYDPALPAPDVAQVTTDEGLTVPYIVRRERGTINRAIYEFAVLFDPSQPWEPWAPQAAWNEKLYYYFDGGAAPQRRQGTVGDEVMIDLALRRGYVVAYATLNRFGFNANSVTSAETAMMVKEKVIEALGPVRYTLGHGGSGGSIQQHLITEGYPGLLDGIQPGASFQDIWTSNMAAQDCSLLVRYFTETSPHLWTDLAQQAAVFGNDSASPPGNCRFLVALWLDKLLMDPVNGLACHNSNGVGPGTPQPWAYQPVLNPTGARCVLQDHQIAMFGKRASDGFANRPYDNVGVQYGLRALKAGTISVDQFLDVNEKIGGRDIDDVWQSERSVADPFALGVAYRTGQVNSGRGIASTPTFDIRNCTNNELHSCFHTYVMRERVKKTNGNTDGHVIFLQESQELSLPLLDRWVADIKADGSDDSLPTKVARHRPAEAVDACWIDGAKVTDAAACAKANPYFGDPRIAAEGPFTDDVLKCQLRTPVRSEYGVSFTNAQWDRLGAIFAEGVCDWAKPGVAAQSSVPWLTFADVRGQVIPGGQPMGDPPVSEAVVLASGSRAAGPNPAIAGTGTGSSSTHPATGGRSPLPLALALGLVGLAVHRLVTRTGESKKEL